MTRPQQSADATPPLDRVDPRPDVDRRATPGDGAPARGATRHGASRNAARDGSAPRARLRWWVAFAVFSALGGLWALAGPVFSVPDEPAHVVYAAAAVRGDLFAPTEGIDTTVTVPATYATAHTAGRCFIYDGTVPAGCAELFVPREGSAEVVTTAGRYPPAYYLYAGSATLILDGAPAIYLMRLLTVLLCAALLASALASAWERSSAWPVVGVVLACTPMVLFFTGAVNPQGPELAAGIALWSGALALFRPRGDGDPSAAGSRPPGRLVARCLAAAAVLAVIRPLSVLWLLLIVAVTLLAVATSRSVTGVLRSRSALAGILAVGAVVVTTGLWVLARDALRQWERPTDLETSRAALFSISKLDMELYEMVGVFGWLDTWSPGVVYVIWFGAVGALVALALALGSRRERLAIAAVVLVSVVMPVASELSSYRESAFAWQGRYILAFSAGLAVLSGSVLAGRLGPAVTRPLVRGLLVAAGIAQVVAFVANLNRYVHGVHGFWWIDEPGWAPPLPAGLLVAAFVATVAVGVVALDRATRRQPTTGEVTPAAC